VNRQFGLCPVLTLVLFSPSCFAQDAPGSRPLEPQLTISVHDYANVPTELLAAAEWEAHRIFHQAGVETVWLNCSPKLEKIQPGGCYIADSTHLVVKVLRHAISAQVRDRPEVLGIATLDENGVGFYGYIFYDRVQRLAEKRRLKHRLLGTVLAHEVGHLMLGSNAHSIWGIMSGQWGGEGLRRVSEGALLFAPLESRVMQDRLGSGRLARVYPDPTVRQQEVSALAP
jgi:hypothetical protein